MRMDNFFNDGLKHSKARRKRISKNTSKGLLKRSANKKIYKGVRKSTKEEDDLLERGKW